eukprot:scaffold2739_cov72-Cylindrotheca_fusiformis.AAC.2
MVYGVTVCIGTNIVGGCNKTANYERNSESITTGGEKSIAVAGGTDDSPTTPEKATPKTIQRYSQYW